MNVVKVASANSFGTAQAEAAPGYQEALAWLYSTQRFGIKLGLENIQRLLRELSVPAKSQRIVHVAGTNGKGSVCAMIDAIGRAQGYRIGLFVSPHLITYRERIRVDGEMIAEEDVAAGLTQIREMISNWELHPTFFEITTALGLMHFKRQGCEVIVLETGLGGRLDATNAVTPVVSVITPISYDHQAWLGNRLEEIAGEKAGIIQPRIPVVSAPQELTADAVIRARAIECEAPLQFIEQPYTTSSLGLTGAHQKQNAAVAVAALKCGGIAVNQEAIRRGLASVDWPARFQYWDERTILDGAHNPAGAGVLCKTWREQFGTSRATIILAVLRDKDIAGIWRELAPVTDFVLFPRIRSERALLPEAAAKIVTGITPTLQYSLPASIREAFDQARTRPNPILLTGSLHFAGEALAVLKGDTAAFEECTQ